MYCPLAICLFSYKECHEGCLWDSLSHGGEQWYSITVMITKTMVIVFHILSPSYIKALRGKFLLVLVWAVFLLSLNVRPERG